MAAPFKPCVSRYLDIAALGNAPPRAARVLLSGLLGGLDGAPLPAAWRAVVRMAYPVELPDKRTVGVDYVRGWLALHHIALEDERIQVDTYLACRVTLDALAHMPGSYSPDYLIERLEGVLDHQLISGYYPRLGLAPYERFASKGGYIVHFAAPAGRQVVADTQWMVPELEADVP